MSDDDEIAKFAVQHAGWFTSTVIGAWAVILRWVIGRHQKHWDRIDEKLDNIDGRLNLIEGRMDERDHYRTGRSTWPGDSR